MNWRIEQKDEFEIFGIERIFLNDDVEKIPDFWAECHKNGSYERLFDDAGGNRGSKGRCVINAICGHIEPDVNEFPYMLFAEKKEGCKTEGYKTAKIPKHTWAVFRVDGLKDHAVCHIPTLFQRAYSEWLPSSEYDKAKGPDMEIYGGDFEEVWIPVVRK